MILRTKFHIGQVIYRGHIEDTAEKRPCTICGGTGFVQVKAVDKSSHRVNCPADSFHVMKTAAMPPCRSGEVIVGFRHFLRITELTVGQIRVKAGGLRGNCNMGGGAHNQSYAQTEEIMCYETGIDGGIIYNAIFPTDKSGIFATREEVEKWGEQAITTCDDGNA